MRPLERLHRHIPVERSDLLRLLLRTQLWTYKLRHAADGRRTQNMHKVLDCGRFEYHRWFSSETYKEEVEVEQTKYTQDRVNQLRRKGHPHYQDIRKKKKKINEPRPD